jgi:hypothetical protein
VLLDVFRLSQAQTLKPQGVAVEHFQAMPRFGDPEIEICNLAGELMTIERREFGELAS